MTDEHWDVLEAAIEHYGCPHQMLKLIEELGELSREVTKVLLDEADIEHLAEEMADVLILLDQMQSIFPEVSQKWPEYYDIKVERLRQRMEKEKAEYDI